MNRNRKLMMMPDRTNGKAGRRHSGQASGGSGWRKAGSRMRLWAVVWSAVMVISACSNAAGTEPGAGAAGNAAAGPLETATEAVQTSVKMEELVSFDEHDLNAAWSENDAAMIALNGASAQVTGSGAYANGGTVSITDAGTYVLSGQLDDGQIVIDNQNDGVVHVVLNGVQLSKSDGAPFYIKEAGKVVVTLQDGTVNSISDGDAYVFPDASTDEPNAPLFSKADLTINGTGKLTVQANYDDGIVSKDDLKILSGILEVKAADDAIKGKDRVAIQDGTFAIEAGGDGIKSTNAEETDKGWVAIAGGSFDIQAGNDGIQAETVLLIDGGTFELKTGGGSENGETHVEEGGFGSGWGGNFGGRTGGPSGSPAGEAAADASEEASEPASAATADTAAESSSAKGLKAGADLIINGGTFAIDAADDAVHSNGNVTIAGGELTAATGDDGIHADAVVTITGGAIDITKSYEGIEGAVVVVNGGDIRVAATDDGINVAGGNDANTGSGTPRDSFSADPDARLEINGGTVYVDAAGDGLDSNGSITMTGGTVLVNGPTGNGNGSLDYDGSFEMSGGFLIAAGSAGMVQATSESSSQNAVLMTFPQTQQAGAIVRLEDGQGKAVATFAPSKDYQAVLISSPELKQGESYTLYSGGSSTGSVVDGLYADGDYSGGAKVVGFEITSSVTWLNESGVTTGGGGMRGGGMGGPGGGGGRMRGGQGQAMPEGGPGAPPADAVPGAALDAGASQ